MECDPIAPKRSGRETLEHPCSRPRPNGAKLNVDYLGQRDKPYLTDKLSHSLEQTLADFHLDARPQGTYIDLPDGTNLNKKRVGNASYDLNMVPDVLPPCRSNIILEVPLSVRKIDCR